MEWSLEDDNRSEFVEVSDPSVRFYTSLDNVLMSLVCLIRLVWVVVSLILTFFFRTRSDGSWTTLRCDVGSYRIIREPRWYL